MLDDLYNQWYAAITEGLRNPSPEQERRLQEINRRIAACEAEQAAERHAAQRERAERIASAKARIAALTENRTARIDALIAEIRRAA